MSSLAYPRPAAGAPRRDLLAVAARWGTDLLLAVPVVLLAAVLLAEVAGDVNVDSWLAVVAGRAIFAHGIPGHDTLTVMTLGRPWVDQQWLAQLIDDGLVRLGGFGLLALVNVTLVAGPVAAAVAGSRRLGAPFRSVLILLPVCLALITPSREIRTQELALPLFVAVVWLCATDSRRPSRRILWCLPLLALWANLHGSVTMGAGLVGLRGLTLAWERRGQWRAPRAWGRPLALLAGPLLALLITPYGTQIIAYYRSTMVNPTLRHAVVEWQPVTVVATTALATFVVLGLALACFARRPGRTTPWEKLALLVLSIATISVVRNAVFLGLLALIVLPVALGYGPYTVPGAARTDTGRPAGAERIRAVINGTLLIGVTLALVLTALATLVRPAGPLVNAGEQPGVLAAVQRAAAADPGLRILADEHFADWLLWRDPALAGRIANDVRFELLTGPQISGLENVFGVRGAGWRRGAVGYRLVVLRRAGDAPAIRAFLREPGRRVLFDASGQVVILRSAAEADRA